MNLYINREMLSAEILQFITLILSNLKNLCGKMKSNNKNQIDFNTAIITYPSDYDGLLTIGTIVDKFQPIVKPTTKVVIAKETADEEIQRDHYHVYYDDEKYRKSVSTKYFDIKLPEPVVLFTHCDKTREYETLSVLASKLGWDNGKEMVAKLDQYVNELNNDKEENSNKYINHWEILEVAHPNIQLKKQYGDKYFMLRYVVKQRLIARSNFDVDEELKYLLDNCEQLVEKANELIEQDILREIGVKTINELIDLLKLYKLKLLRKQKQHKGLKLNNKKRGRKAKSDIPEEVKGFVQELRRLVLQKKFTKKEVMKKIMDNQDWWTIFCLNYINYNKLITDMFKNAPPSKPKRNYNLKFWLPRKLYDYIMWLDDWVRRWTLGLELEHRPKGLVLIGESRTGKTSLMSLFGEFSYIKNVWNMDNWEGATAYTIMDDMDAGDEGKGLSFCWYKPFFGAQDAVTVTDKFKPKQDIYNGKPLIWINNYDITESFQSKTAQDYINKNMIIVKLTRPLLEPQPDWIEGHNDYVEFDPKTTWYFKNIVCQTLTCPECGGLDVLWNDTNQPGEFEKLKEQWKCYFCENNNKNQEPIKFIDETQKTIEKCKEQEEDLEPLSERKKRLDYEQEKGRPTKRIRTKD